MPEDPVRTGNSQTPIRMYSRDPVTGDQVWSLISSYVPRNKSNLVGVVAADSDPTSKDYGRILVEEPRTDNVPGPTQAYNNLISDPQITRKTQKFKLGDATTQYGSVTSVPLSSGLMYVVPVYAHALAGRLDVVPHAALRDGAVRLERRHRRHPRERHQRHGRLHPTARPEPRRREPAAEQG